MNRKRLILVSLFILTNINATKEATFLLDHLSTNKYKNIIIPLNKVIQFEENETIRDLKNKIRRKWQLFDWQYITLEGVSNKDDNLITSLFTKEINDVLYPSVYFKVLDEIIASNNKLGTFHIELKKHETIADLKNKIKENLKLDDSQQIKIKNLKIDDRELLKTIVENQGVDHIIFEATPILGKRKRDESNFYKTINVMVKYSDNRNSKMMPIDYQENETISDLKDILKEKLNITDTEDIKIENENISDQDLISSFEKKIFMGNAKLLVFLVIKKDPTNTNILQKFKNWWSSK